MASPFFTVGYTGLDVVVEDRRNGDRRSFEAAESRVKGEF